MFQGYRVLNSHLNPTTNRQEYNKNGKNRLQQFTDGHGIWDSRLQQNVNYRDSPVKGGKKKSCHHSWNCIVYKFRYNKSPALNAEQEEGLRMRIGKRGWEERGDGHTNIAHENLKLPAPPKKIEIKIKTSSPFEHPFKFSFWTWPRNPLVSVKNNEMPHERINSKCNPKHNSQTTWEQSFQVPSKISKALLKTILQTAWSLYTTRVKFFQVMVSTWAIQSIFMQGRKMITIKMADISLRANHLICIARWALAAASVDSNRRYTKPALLLHDRLVIWRY